MALLWPRGEVPRSANAVEPQAQPISAVVENVRRAVCDPDDPASALCQFLDVRVTSGEHSGTVSPIVVPAAPGTTRFHDEDRILVEPFLDADGQLQLSFIDFRRTTPLLVLGGVFVVAVLALGRLRGLGAIGGLVVSLLALTLFVLPSILRGNDAVLVALVGSAFIAFVALFLSHGVNIGTAIALVGTFASMTIIAKFR